MFEAPVFWDMQECLEVLVNTAKLSTKKPMNTGLMGYFFTFLQVEPGALLHPPSEAQHSRGV
jgi:hypothetical protein